VPSPAAGTVTAVLVELNAKVSEGTPIVELDAAEAKAPDTAPAGEEGARSAPVPSQTTDLPDADKQTQVLVIGSGPGGYTAAFRAADLGLEVTLVERYPSLGGVCLNVGCIPSKALLHAAQVVAEAEDAAEFGVRFGEPEIELDKLRGWKEAVVGKLTGGLAGLARQRKVEGSSPAPPASHRTARSTSTEPRSPSRAASSPPGPARPSCPACPTIRASWTQRERWPSPTCPSGCWWWAAGSSASRWRRSTPRSGAR
jgi:pyruvate/2-oxoglutarate dehydrogenase complex dihydrolipoamide acyltransferase (E2) component